MKRFYLIVILFVVFFSFPAYGQVGEWVGDFVSIDFSALGDALIDIVIDILRGILTWISEVLLPLFGLEPDFEAIFDGLSWIEDNALMLNDLIPVFTGMVLIAGGMVLQWIVLIVRYLFGYFVGG